jgi:hypothetical protein
MATLAKEYGISIPEVFKHIKALGFEIWKATTPLTAKQAEAFRRRMKAEAARPTRPQVVYAAPHRRRRGAGP